MAVATRRIPLLRDSHTHPAIYAAFMHGIDLGREAPDSRETALRLIREHARAAPGAWTIAYGWNNARCRLCAQDFQELGPVVLFNLSLHGVLVNAAGRALLASQSPQIAHNLHDQAWVEQNLLAVLSAFARGSVSAERLRRFYQRLLEEQGIWHAEEMLLVDGWELAVFEEAGLSCRTRFWAAPEQFESLASSQQEKIHGIKLFSDGAIGTFTAALSKPYAAPSQSGSGMLIYEPQALEGLLRRYLGRKAVAVHAIGDRAIDQVVAALESAGVAPVKGVEVRIEHAQFISRQTAHRAKTMGIGLCMQPNFSDDSVHYAERLPPEFPQRNNPFRMLIDEVGFVPGDDLFFGSDGMPHGFAEALRQALFPPYEGQRLTLEEFVAGYCMPEAPGQIEICIDDERRRVSGRVEAGPPSHA